MMDMSRQVREVFKQRWCLYTRHWIAQASSCRQTSKTQRLQLTRQRSTWGSREMRGAYRFETFIWENNCRSSTGHCPVARELMTVLMTLRKEGSSQRRVHKIDFVFKKGSGKPNIQLKIYSKSLQTGKRAEYVFMARGTEDSSGRCRNSGRCRKQVDWHGRLVDKTIDRLICWWQHWSER